MTVYLHRFFGYLLALLFGGLFFLCPPQNHLTLQIQAATANTKVAIVPFVSASSSKTSFAEISKKLGALLKQKNFDVASLSGKSASSSAAQLPFKAEFNAGMLLYKLGRSLSREKNYEKAKKSLLAAKIKIEKSLIHIQEFDLLLELHRLLGLNYFRLGENEKGEEAIQRMGYLAPKQQFAQSKLFPMLRRILKRAQKQAQSGSGKIQISAPEGATVTLNQETLSPPFKVKQLQPGTHYVWVKKPGFVPFGQAIQVKGSGWTKVDVSLSKASSGNSGPNFSSDSRQLQSRLKQKQLDGEVRRLCNKIGKGLGVQFLLFGYFTKAESAHDLSLFSYRTLDGSLKKHPKYSFDLELLEVDIKLVQIAVDLTTQLKNFDKLPNQSWQAIVAAAPPVTRRETPAPAARPSTSAPAPRPTAVAVAPPAGRGRINTEDNPDLDDFDPDSYAKKRGLKNVVKPSAVPRPTPPPPRRVVQPEPVRTPPVQPTKTIIRVRRVPPRAEVPIGGSDSPDPDDPIPPRREPAPAPVRTVTPPVRTPEPPRVVTPRPEPPRRVAIVTPPVRTEPVAPPTPRPTVEPPTVPQPRRSSSGNKVSLADLRPEITNRPGFDPDRNVDWSHPIPQEARNGNGRRYVPNVDAPRRTRRHTRRVAVTRQPVRQEPPVVAPPVRRDPPVVREPEPARVAPPVRRESGSGWDEPEPAKPLIRNPGNSKPGVSKPITQQWWFWTAIGAGVVVGAVTTTAIVMSQPATAYDVFVQVNPPL